jgi:hypothetical protein
VVHQSPTPRRAAMNWAKRLMRLLGIEISTCQRCGGALGLSLAPVPRVDRCGLIRGWQ